MTTHRPTPVPRASTSHSSRGRATTTAMIFAVAASLIVTGVAVVNTQRMHRLPASSSFVDVPSPGCGAAAGCKSILAADARKRASAAPKSTRINSTVIHAAYIERPHGVDASAFHLQTFSVNWTLFNISSLHELASEAERREWISRTSLEALQSVSVNAFGVSKVKARLSGPLCVFVPANGHDERHEREAFNFVETWGDDSVVLYSESADFLTAIHTTARDRGVHTVRVDDEMWKVWHQRQVLNNTVLIRRGPTASNIRGRGQLSIPLFHWISQLVKRNDPLVQNCKWFMKCDTDTYLRRKHLEDNVLSHLDPSQPLHVGVPVQFIIKPWNTTSRSVEFEYNIGGPGYTFSRALMQSVDMTACVRSMALDPILLIHDDVATGYCASYHAANSRLVELKTAVSGTSAGIVQELLRDDMLRLESHGKKSKQSLQRMTARACFACITSAHPVSSLELMKRLAAATAASTDASDVDAPQQPTMNDCRAMADSCEGFLIAGQHPRIGSGWNVSPRLRDVMDFWPVGNYSYVVQANDRVRAVKAIQDRIKLLHHD